MMEPTKTIDRPGRIVKQSDCREMKARIAPGPYFFVKEEILVVKKGSPKEGNETLAEQIRAAEAGMRASLVQRGDKIAAREKYKYHAGLEAVQFFLIERHHWLPSQVRSMSDSDLSFALDDVEENL